MILEARQLAKAYDGIQAVRDVSLSVNAGEMVALIGPNGAGKTTCFNMLNGQIVPDSGAILLDGRTITGLAPRQIWRLGVGRTFQITAAFGSMTARENVQMVLLSQQRRLFSFLSSAARFQPKEADSFLERVGMGSQANKPCATLAYGGLKRVELAMALAAKPRLLLMDEPTAGMAADERASLMQLAAQLTREEALAVLFTEHDMDVVFGFANRVTVLQGGEVIAAGPPDEVRANVRVQDVYLGAA